MLLVNITPIFSVLFLVLLEGVLSFDNAIVLALMTKHLPPAMQKKALYYGIYGAFLFRFLSLFALTWLMELGWIKSMGGVYLLYMSGKFFLAKKAAEPKRTFSEFAFWRTVVAVELMDIAFSLDSVLAAVSISQNYFIVISGAILGIIMMRFAASIFIGLVARFPKLEETAYLLIAIVGLKLFIQGFNFEGVDFHSSQNIFAWAFWLFMAFALMLGFRSVERNNISNAQSTES